MKRGVESALTHAPRARGVVDEWRRATVCPCREGEMFIRDVHKKINVRRCLADTDFWLLIPYAREKTYKDRRLG